MTEPNQDTDLQEYEVEDADGVTRTYLLNEADAKERQGRKVGAKQAPAAKNKQASASMKG